MHKSLALRLLSSLLSPLLSSLLLLSILIILFVSSGTLHLWAQADNSGTVTADDVNVIARELWCPLCSGVRLDACELKACEQMKDMIAIKLEQGEDLDSIRAYFLDQYGPQILGEPPRQGFSWLAWILPIAAMVGGALLIWLRMKQMVRPATQGATISAQPGIGVSEEEAAKLREELKRYG